MNWTRLMAWALLCACLVCSPGVSRADDDPPAEEEGLFSAETFGGLAFRSLGPAMMAGRIGDLAVDPEDPSHYYVAACSGGVWKTVNAGTTFQPVFDDQGSYSIGCLALDPGNSSVVWVGTGENNSQRSVSFGDGVYKSLDGGKNFKNMGLPESEHIGMIAIDPRDTDVVYVAAQGPLWRSGGDRGLYKTIDGGATWDRVLHVSDDTGINEVHLDPRDPDTIYASAYQRRRHVWTLIDGGPESGVHKSTDGGRTWKTINKGLPRDGVSPVDMGRIGLDIAPAQPDTLYAIVEAAEGKSGFFRSTDRGESWERRSDRATSSPQYYNEIVCDPLDPECVYSLDTYLHVTRDGGKTFGRVPRKNRHVDDHALWIDPGNTRHMIVGCDGGVYDTWDAGQNWHFKTNLPVTQFYRVAVDDSKPFYFVYGGTQDNNTQGGPSRTRDRAGIGNADWFVTVGGDGYETQVDPEDPNIVYSQWQYGGLVRHDRRSGERVDIRPQVAPGAEPLRWNWDTPLLLSPHDHKRLYFAANILFRSDDRGDSWRAISGDLTRQIDRNALEVMGRVQRVDAVAKDASTSVYGNCVSFSESPLVEDLLYVGTDDGLIHVTEDAGGTWRVIDACPGIPENTYVSCLTASPMDPDTVYASFDNHKQGDFSPYLLRSRDRGRTWESIAGDIPGRHIVYSVLEDHVRPDLLFIGTEFGCFFTIDGGGTWIRLKGSLPTIAVRDMAIQRREDDLVLGTFGRGFYVLDDYSSLRHVSRAAFEESESILFPVKPAWQYVEKNRLGGRNGKGWQGASFYAAKNPPYGAVFTYHLKEKLLSAKEARRKRERQAEKDGAEVPYPTYEELKAEDREQDPRVLLIVRDSTGAVVKRVPGPRGAGIHRVAWDLRYPSVEPTQLKASAERPDWSDDPVGVMSLPGTYTVELGVLWGNTIDVLAGPQSFDVVPLDIATFAAEDKVVVFKFQRRASDLYRAVGAASRILGEARHRLRHLRQSALDTPVGEHPTLLEIDQALGTVADLALTLDGDPTLRKRNQASPQSISSRVDDVLYNQLRVTSPPTKTQQEQVGHAEALFAPTLAALRELLEQVRGLEEKMEHAGAPWTPGRLPVWPPR